VSEPNPHVPSALLPSQGLNGTKDSMLSVIWDRRLLLILPVFYSIMFTTLASVLLPIQPFYAYEIPALLWGKEERPAIFSFLFCNLEGYSTYYNYSHHHSYVPFVGVFASLLLRTVRIDFPSSIQVS